ncbi:MAG: NAD(P)-dependent oxidoreductase [Candidatus Diapherotrites archaeon]|nr:NAD(P)-dependent oxidoreductase [Candidatus Diapherotrites archaeon]
MKERVLVTGSNGFLGKEVCKILKEKDYEVIEYDRNLGCDVLDRNSLEKVVSKANYVIHLAAKIDEKDKDIFKVNIDGTRNILEASAKNKIKKLIFASSVGVLGNFEGCADENYPYNPITTYEKSKTEAEKLVISYQEAVPVVIARLALIFGPNKFWKFVIDSVKERFPIIGDGKNKFQTIYVKNAADAIVFLLERGEIGEIYNVADEEIPTLEEFYVKISEEFNIKDKPRHINYYLAMFLLPIKTKGFIQPELVKRLSKNRCYNIEKIKSLGYKQKYSLERAIKDTIKELENEE